MPTVRQVYSALLVSALCVGTCFAGTAQAAGNSGSISGTVVDPTGAVVPNAMVQIHNPVSGFDRSTKTDDAGRFTLPNIPFNLYHLKVTATGFATFAQDVEPRSAVPLNLTITLKVAESTTQVTVEGGSDLVENDPTFHTDVDKGLFDKLPLESSTSGALDERSPRRGNSNTPADVWRKLWASPQELRLSTQRS
jgi:Carboxypeptidase regulatory-like domain